MIQTGPVSSWTSPDALGPIYPFVGWEGTDYDPAEDVLRIEVNPDILKDTQESLEYSVDKIGDNKGTISFAWDKTKVSIEFENL